MTAFGAHIDERLLAQEGAVAAASAQCEKVAAKMVQVEAVATDAAAQVGALAGSAAGAAAVAEHADQRARALGETVQALQAAHADTRRLLHALQEQAAAGSGASSSPGAAGSEPSAAEANPRHVILGNLGWDTPAAVLSTPAQQLLASVGVAQELVAACALALGRQGTGSTCDILFSTADAATAFILHVRSADREFVEGRRIWADINARAPQWPQRGWFTELPRLWRMSGRSAALPPSQ